AHDLSRTYRCVSILLGRAALRADQHVHLLFPPVMRMHCANRTDSSDAVPTLPSHERRDPQYLSKIGILFTGKIMAASRRGFLAVPAPIVGAGLPASSWRAVAFSVGGDGGGRPPEHLAH